MLRNRIILVAALLAGAVASASAGAAPKVYQITIDRVTFHAVPVPNGLCTHVDSLEFSRGL